MCSLQPESQVFVLSVKSSRKPRSLSCGSMRIESDDLVGLGQLGRWRSGFRDDGDGDRRPLDVDHPLLRGAAEQPRTAPFPNEAPIGRLAPGHRDRSLSAMRVELPRNTLEEDVHESRARTVCVVHEPFVRDIPSLLRVPRVDARLVSRGSSAEPWTSVSASPGPGVASHVGDGEAGAITVGDGSARTSPPTPASATINAATSGDADDHVPGLSPTRPADGTTCVRDIERRGVVLMAPERVADLSLEVVHRASFPIRVRRFAMALTTSWFSAPTEQRRTSADCRLAQVLVVPKDDRRPLTRGEVEDRVPHLVPHLVRSSSTVAGTGNVASRARDERSTLSRRSLEVWRFTIVRRRYASNASGWRRCRNRPATRTNASWTRSRAASRSPLRKYASRRAAGACRT